MRRFLLTAGLGAAAAYFLDPDNGKRRRTLALDRLGATTRRFSSRVEDQASHLSSTARGLKERAERQGDDAEGAWTDDATLAHQVETQIFRDPDVPKGKINVNAADGVVVLRGEMDRPEEIRSLENQVRDMPGVVAVENLLHLPGTPPPMS